MNLQASETKADQKMNAWKYKAAVHLPQRALGMEGGGLAHSHRVPVTAATVVAQIATPAPGKDSAAETQILAAILWGI